MTAFVLHVIRDRGACVGSATTRRVLHRPACKWAGRARHAVRVNLDEALRLWRARDSVPTTQCKVCRPYEVMNPSAYPRDPACTCPHWRALYGCPVHGPTIKAQEAQRFDRFLHWAAAPVNAPVPE